MAVQTKISLIRSLSHLSRGEIFRTLLPMVESQTHPMIFSYNDRRTHKRVPLPLQTQKVRLWQAIGRILNLPDESMPDSPDDAEIPDDEPTPEEEVIEEAEEEAGIPAQPMPDQERYFIERVDSLREFIADKARVTNSDGFDSLANRVYKDGIRGIRAGISADAMIQAATIHWKPELRAEANIRTVDLKDECEQLESEDGKVKFHRLAGYVLKLAEARIPIMLVGESGTGKSHLCRQLAGILNMEYAFCPMTAGAQPSWLLGSICMPTDKFPQGFRPRLLLGDANGSPGLFVKGGVFCFEEIDASEPNMLLVMNQVLDAGDEGYFTNPADGGIYYKSEDFVPVCNGNTWGMGASQKYKGREGLDFATLDRFRMGRVWLDFDPKLAATIALAQ
jgi:energy-coupling factor transporter ATP-binding protein EcfA2